VLENDLRAKPIFPGQILVTRLQAAAMLGNISVASIIRLESSGRLTPVKLSGVNSKTFYKIDEVRTLAEGRGQP
jgi:hypothetical protein